MADIERLQGGLYNNLGNGSSENQRTPNVFKNIGSAGALTAVWTPAAGKSFRVMGFHITATADAASATNEQTVTVFDQSTGIWVFQAFFPTSAVTTAPGTLLIASITLPGNGYLSAAPNNLFRFQSTAALTTGTFRMNAWGTEE